MTLNTSIRPSIKHNSDGTVPMMEGDTLLLVLLELHSIGWLDLYLFLADL